MATPFENFVNTELPKRLSTDVDPLSVPAGWMFITTGVGLGMELANPEDYSFEGKSAYHIALENGFQGTEAEWLESLKGKSAYQIALELGFEGSEQEFLDSLNGSDGQTAFELAVSLGFEGTEQEWLEGLVGQSAYQLAVEKGFEGSEDDWLESLKGADGQSAYALAVENGFEGDEAEWLASLKGERGEAGPAGPEGPEGAAGVDGKSAYELAVDEGFEGSLTEWLESLDGSNLTPEGLAQLLTQRGYTVKDLLKVVGPTSAVSANSGLFNFLFLFDKRIEQDLAQSGKQSQYMVEMGRMEAEGYSYWKNEPGNGTSPRPADIPWSEVRLFDDGRLQLGSMTRYIELSHDGLTQVDGENSQFTPWAALSHFAAFNIEDAGKVLMNTGSGMQWQTYPFDAMFRQRMIASGFQYDETTGEWIIDQGSF